MSEQSTARTYQPEYAHLPVVENSLSGYRGRKCPECGELGETEAKIALDRGDGTYSLWTVYRCPVNENVHWRTTTRTTLPPWRKTATDPGMHGFEVVGDE